MSVGYTLEGLKIRKAMGNERLKKHQYKEAIADFKMVADNVFITDDRKAALKLGSYNSIALCYIEMGELDNAYNATVEAVCIFDMMRPNEFAKSQHKKNDILFKPLHTTFIRQGQIKEKKGEFLDAIDYYQKANLIFPNGEGTKKIKECLFNNYGVPEIDLDDKRLKPFSNLANDLFDISKLMVGIIKKINEGSLTKDDLVYIDQKGITELLLGILQIHIESEDIVDVMLTFASYFFKNKCKCGWKNIQAIDKVLNEYKDNATIVDDIINILEFCPKDLFSHFANSNSLLNLIELFKVELEDNDTFNKLFFVLFRIVNNTNGTLDILKNTNIIEIILKYKTLNALNFLTKLAFNEELANKIKTNEVIEWIFTMLQDNINEKFYIDVCLIVLTRVFQTAVTELTPMNKEYAAKCVDNVIPILMKNSKDIEVVRDVYGILIPAIPYAPEKVKAYNILRITSLMISTNIENKNDSYLFLKYVYKCGKQGLVEEIKEVKAILPTILKLIEKYPKIRQIVERVVYLAIILEHPNKIQLLRAALVQFPQSKVLKPYVYMLKEIVNEELKQINK